MSISAGMDKGVGSIVGCHRSMCVFVNVDKVCMSMRRHMLDIIVVSSRADVYLYLCACAHISMHIDI